jgi:hypothetical protein
VNELISPTEARPPTHDSGPDAHELLLELAGRLDDDLLAWARELVAVGEEGQAVELASAALAAERVVLPPALRAAVVAASRAAHTDLDVETELAPAVPEDVTGHRFDASAGSGDRVAAVLAGLPARRLAGCTLHLTWRRTPAGAAPGPVPRAVVLVETGPDRSPDVLAYLLTTELDRAGVPASVEVFTTGNVLPAYHAAALRSARRIEVGASVIAPAGVVVARTAAEAAARAEPPALVEPEPVDARTDTAALLVMPSGGDAAGPSGEVRRAGRRRKREPAGPLEPGPENGGPGGGVDEAPDTDPFHGPLRVPLLAPLLDPTTPDADAEAPPAVPTPIRPVPAQPAVEEPAAPQPVEESSRPTEVDAPEPVTSGPSDETRPVAPVVAAAEPTVPAEGPDDVPQEWEDDWRSGDWAMPPGGLPQTPADASAFDVFETPTPPVEDNAVERTGRTELPSRTASNRADAELPSRTDLDRLDPAPPAAGPELPTRTPEGAGSGLFGAGRPHGAEGTAAFPPAAGPMPRRTPATERPADASLFDSPTARVGPPPRRTPPRPPDPAPPASEVPLFDEPARDEHRPDGPSPDSARQGRRRRPDADDPEPGPAPAVDAEPSVLGSTERDLLAQLQAELADRERRPRPYRRARSEAAPAVNGHGVNGHGVNGHGADGDRLDGPGADPGAG